MKTTYPSSLRTYAAAAEALAEIEETREQEIRSAAPAKSTTFLEVIRDLSERGHRATATFSHKQLWTPIELLREQLQRGQSADSFPAGGALIPSEIFTVADALRPRSTILTAGAQVVSVAADQTVPNITGGAAAQWVSETGEVTATSVVLGNLNLVPKRCGALLKVSKQLLLQAPKIAEATLRRDLLGAIGQALDVASFSGLGGVEPLGLANADIPTVTFGGAPTLDDACDFEQAIGDAYAEQGPLSFISSPTVRSKWRQTEGLAGSGVPLWDRNEILGKPALATATVTGNKMFYGNFSDWLIVMFGDLFTVISDPYTSKKEFIQEFYVELRADMGPMRRLSFAKSTDSAAQ